MLLLPLISPTILLSCDRFLSVEISAEPVPNDVVEAAILRFNDGNLAHIRRGNSRNLTCFYRRFMRLKVTL